MMVKSTIREKLNASLDRVVRTELIVLDKSRPAFRVSGCVGFALAVVLTSGLVIHAGLSLPVIAGVAVVVVLVFLAVVMATKIVTGEERIIYYHHEIAVTVASALFLWLLRQPVLAYLDITILGVGLFLVFGRMGCFLVGCCHGRPSPWGARYHEEHAVAGFVPYYVGVRLFPIQAVESLSVFCIVVIGAAFIMTGSPSGTALAWYAVAYGLARFSFEFLRGDPDRPYLWGFSQPQWISLLLILFTVSAEFGGALPKQVWHIPAAVCLVVAICTVTLVRRFDRVSKFRLLHPHHIKEIATALEVISGPSLNEPDVCPWTMSPVRDSINVAIACTSLGVRISAGRTETPRGAIHHYSFSTIRGRMTEEAAEVLARQILLLKRADGELLSGNQGVFHLLISPAVGKELTHR
jgi:prolipoprotein diacylglyceryltransferase